MTVPASATPTHDPDRTWSVARLILVATGAGGLGAAAYAGAESLYTLATTELMPLELPLARDEFAVGSGMLLGLVCGGIAVVLAGRKAGARDAWRLLVALWASIALGSALWAVPELQPAWRDLGAASPLFVIGFSLLGASLLDLKPGRLWRSVVGPERLVLAGVATAAINAVLDLQSRVLPPLGSARGILSAVAVLSALLLLLVGCDRVMSGFYQRVQSPATRMLAVAVLPGLAFVLLPLAARGLSAPSPLMEVAESASLPAGAARPPDIIVVVMDATRADVLTPYGAPADLTPNLAELAQRALVYQHALAPSSWTLPSHATLLTGLYPMQHGADRATADQPTIRRPELGPTTPLRNDVGTLATWLSARGYHTGAILANAGYLHSDFGLARGFSLYDARFRLRRRRPSLMWPLMTWLAPDRTERLVRWARTAEDILGESLEWLDRQGDAPVFLLINLMEAHDPYAPDLPFASRAGRIPGMADPFLPVSRGERPLRPEERRHLRATYEASVQTMDRSLGRFFQGLRERNRLDGTALLLTSDHGDMMGEHGMLRHGREVWEPLVHVPLIFHYPGGRYWGQVRAPVHLVDVAPTLLNLASLYSGSLEESLPGRLLPLVRAEVPTEAEVPTRGSTEAGVRAEVPTEAEAPTRRPTETGVPAAAEGIAPGRPLLVIVHPSPDDVALLGDQWDQSVSCIYQGSLKYCETSRGLKRLFDLEADPGEEQNLAAKQPQEVARLSGAMLEAGQMLRGKVLPPSSSHTNSSLSREAHEQLRALGYVQ